MKYYYSVNLYIDNEEVWSQTYETRKGAYDAYHKQRKSLPHDFVVLRNLYVTHLNTIRASVAKTDGVEYYISIERVYVISFIKK